MRHAAPLLVLVTLLSVQPLAGQEAAPELIKVADGKITFPVPQGWTRKPPASRIVEHEFAADPVEGDEGSLRVTVMGAGGGIEANIERWAQQMKRGANDAKVEKKLVGGVQVYVVDISGVFQDRPGGPFAGGKLIERENYRMLGAIVVSEAHGQYFVKAIGPAKTVAAQEAAFRKLVDGVKVSP